MERKNGFLIVDDYQELPDDDCISRGNFPSCWLDNGEIYLFKNYKDEMTCYKELVYSRFASKIGIPNVGYDLASFHNRKGVITKKCTKELPISMRQILVGYLETVFNEIDIKILYSIFNIDKIERILMERYQQKENFSLEELHRDLLIKFISQFLFANCDLNTKNLDIDESICAFLPLYDFGSCGNVNFHHFKGGYNYFSLKRFYTEDMKEHPRVTLRNFLEKAEKNEIELFKMYLETARATSLEELFSEIEESMNTFLPEKARKLKHTIHKHLIDVEKTTKK